jgi:hypothetical protein
MRTKSGWWFQTWLSFSNIYGIILPIASQFFKKMVKTTNQKFKRTKRARGASPR